VSSYLGRDSYRTHPQVRPFLLARGRTRALSRYPIMVHTIVSAPHYDLTVAAMLTRTERLVYEQARQRISVAEVSAHTGLSLGLVRVVIGDLAQLAAIVIHPATEQLTAGSAVSISILERVLDGLLRL
jgi:hypothetical protein